MPRRRCIVSGGGHSDDGYAIEGTSRCRAHTRTGWHSKPRERDLAYASSEYQRNRGLAIEREPTCHWKIPGVCTGRSTTADHLIPVSRGGSNRLDNLVGACEPCNRRRGIDLANETRRNPRR